MSNIRAEFAVHRLNAAGLGKAEELAEEFSRCLGRVLGLMSMTPADHDAMQEHMRCKALVRTKLQEACFFAKRAIALHEDNQEED